MAELLVGGMLVVASLVILGLIVSMISFVVWLVLLPFKLLGFLFQGVAALLLLPFLLVLGFVGVLAFGVGLIAFLLPAMPLVLLALGIWWLVKRRQGPAAAAHYGAGAGAASAPSRRRGVRRSATPPAGTYDSNCLARTTKRLGAGPIQLNG